MALDYLPFMGILIVYSLEALLFLEQRFERTDALPISEREIQNIRWLPDVDKKTVRISWNVMNFRVPFFSEEVGDKLWWPFKN